MKILKKWLFTDQHFFASKALRSNFRQNLKIPSIKSLSLNCNKCQDNRMIEKMQCCFAEMSFANK